MDDKKYLDQNGLKDYDALIKRYIDRKIAEAIRSYENGDYTEIEDYDPEIVEYTPGD